MINRPCWQRSASLALAGLALVAAGCSAAPATPTPTRIPEAAVAVRVSPVAKGTISSAAIYSGNIQAKSQVSVVPKVPGRIDKLNVDFGSVVKAGDVIAEIESATLKTQVSQAEAALAAAQAKLGTVEEGPRAEQVGQAEANARAASEKVASLQTSARAESIAQAEANLRGAQARLDQLKKGATPEQITAATLAVEQAKDTLWAAQISRDGACNPRNPKSACDAAQAQVAAAETAVNQYGAQLSIVTAPPTTEQVAQAQAAVDAAAQQLALARNPVNAHDVAQAQAAADAAAKQVEYAKKPYTDNDRKAAQAGVDQARAALEVARLTLKDATVTAPFDGLVTTRYLAQGALASTATPIVSLISSDVEIVVNVEEVRIGQVLPGQAAAIAVAAYPGEEFPATVSSLSPSLDSKSRTRAVRIRPNASGKLLDGMFAQVRISGAERPAALLVPSQAVVQKDGRSLVYVVRDGRAAALVVNPGAADGKQVEVADGLAEGDLVVISGQETLTDGQLVQAQQ